LSFQGWLALILAAALVAPPVVSAQEAAPPPAKQAGGTLKIVTLEGEGAKNVIKTRHAVQPVVEVRDENDKPVSGAEVVFQLPAAGPGGVFNGWMRTQTLRTNAEGQAGTNGFTPNDEEGRFNIKVTATSNGKTGSTIIAQSNTRTGDQSSSGASKWWKVLAIAGGAAAAGGIVAATRNGDSSGAAGKNPVTIAPGTITVTGPR
jgi:hypothetical protein